MHNPIPQLTALLLFVHISFGCCLHHAHTCEMNCCAVPSSTAESCPCSDHQHDNDSPLHKDDEQSSKHGKSPCEHRCGGDKCVFNKTETSSDVLVHFSQDLARLDFAPGLTSPQVASATCATDMEARQPAGYPPLRTHLFHQILLI